MEEHVSKLIKINLVKFQTSYSMEYKQDGWKGKHTIKWINLTFLQDSFKLSMFVFKEKNPDCKILGKLFRNSQLKNFNTS